jgi:hypothetical protein
LTVFEFTRGSTDGEVQSKRGELFEGLRGV